MAKNMEKKRLIENIDNGKMMQKKTYVATKEARSEQQKLDQAIKAMLKSTFDIKE